MKYLIFAFLFIFLSCNDSGGYCEKLTEEENIRCVSDRECVEDFEDGYICFDSRNTTEKKSLISLNLTNNCCKQQIPEVQCVYNLCNGFNYDFGTCELRLAEKWQSESIVKCNEGALFKESHTSYGYLKECVENKCTTSNDCAGLGLIDSNSSYIYVPVCSSEGKCVEESNQ